MSDTPSFTPAQAAQDVKARAEAERLTKLEEARQERLRQAEIDKAERIRKAEVEKAERVAKAKADRAKELAAEAEAQKQEARKLLPTPDSLAAARATLSRRAARARRILFAQLLLIVLVPTGLVTAYAAFEATPLFEARAVVVISKAGSDREEGLGGLLGAVGGAQSNLHEAFMAHEFVQSRTMMDLLEQDMGLITRYAGPEMDPVRRLRDIPALGVQKIDMFGRFVESAINIQTGLMTLYVRALSPQEAEDVARQIITRLDEQVNLLSDELFNERILLADGAVTDARAALVQAQKDLTRLQISSGEANPQARVEGVYRTISQLETELETLRGQINAAEVVGQADSAQTQRLRDLEAAQSARIAELRQQLVVGGGQGPALNRLLLDFELAALQVQIAEETLSAALAARVQAREKAALGRSRFQVVVPPNAGNIASSPDNLVIGFITFLSTLSMLGIYRLMRSSRVA